MPTTLRARPNLLNQEVEQNAEFNARSWDNVDWIGCEEKKHLASEYEAAAHKFAAAVSELNQKTGTSQQIEYKRRLQRIADESLLKSEQARLALETTLL